MKFNFTKVMYVALTMLTLVSTAAAQTEAAGGGGGNRTWTITGALAVGIAAAGGALGDAKAIAAACEGTARNPAAGGRIFTMMILGLALIETLVLITFATVLLNH